MNKKKKQIIEGAHRLFIEKGFVHTSIQDILDEVKIAKGTFYNYFISKNECLIAILEYAKEESEQQRKEMSLGRRADDEELFIEQVTIRLKTDKKHNLMALFSTTSFMSDPELREFMFQQHLGEVQWVAGRLMDLYGDDIREIAFDQAVIFLGILQHSFQVTKLTSQKKHSLEEIIRYSLQQVKLIIQHQEQSSTVLFPFERMERGENERSSQLKKQIEKLIENPKMKEKMELLEFLLAELQNEAPRLQLIESVWRTLSQSEEKIEPYREMLYTLWEFIEKRRK
ncbi:TetR/AcrR family transcriptional regulator [Robertmurraya yapensis]|uniref:TetR/AcrR family transcriptional regulator n=1 Tax=Bacillus yapensis TaxID=2492960 RepID=A0A3S0IP60_9BACI|nr:TetR/AcrR family transcriptional regulator [Bacillus yapensis]RTR28430.1 TetR/AcrR family transcriptional regulator [Bacillus yapensis]TKS94491.1 TetR family transcriptional regulator [Bacillus yapensis]